MQGKATIQRKLQRVILIICGLVLLLTGTAYFAYEVYLFKDNSIKHLTILGEVISSNITAALAFDDKKAADEILASLKAEPHFEEACLYDTSGRIFSKYPSGLPDTEFPAVNRKKQLTFSFSGIEGFQPVIQDNKYLGTLYIRSDIKAIYERLELYGFIAITVILLAFLLAYFLSRKLQRGISGPISSLATTAKLISEQHDYSVRAVKISDDEMGLLTDAFNSMLQEIERQNLEIIHFNQQLEHKVEERTLELELTNKELESFSYSVSHDLTAPLRRISIFTELYLERNAGKIKGDDLELINKVLNNSSRMRQLIKDILAFSRLGKQELVRERVKMQKLVASCADELIRAENGRSIELILHTLPDISADKITLQQVWENLISNAIKYTSRRETAIIEIGAEETEKEVTYSIKDNGAGFNMEYYDKLFAAFQRLHDLHDFEGTGIGLALVEKIITRHGGRIWASSEPDQGAVFYFSLPK